jgi:flagellar brake protein
MVNVQIQKPSTKTQFVPGYSEYLVSGRASVCSALSSLVESKQVLSVWQRAKDTFFFTTLMAFDPSKELIYLDRGAEGINRTTNLADDFRCYAQIDNQQVQFDLQGLLQDFFYGTPAWIANLPERIVGTQQREYSRTPIPVAKPSFCKIKGIDGYACPTEIRVQLVDVSAGGIGFVAPLIMCGVLAPNTTFNHCELQIYNELPVMVNLKMRSSYVVTSRSGIKAVRVGAEITAISPKASEVLTEITQGKVPKSTNSAELSLAQIWGT